MSVAAVRTPAEYENQLRNYLYERSEESRAVRVGEKEVSERAEIVDRFRDLFSREQLEALRAAEEKALEDAILAARVEFKGEELPLRSAQARLAVLPDYADREQLGAITADRSAEFNDDRLELLRAD